MKQLIWKRPGLPGAHTSKLFVGGVCFLFLGVFALVFYFGTFERQWAATLLYAGSMLMGFGFWMIIAGCIVTEVRRLAFDMARRAGEVSEEEIDYTQPVQRG